MRTATLAWRLALTLAVAPLATAQKPGIEASLAAVQSVQQYRETAISPDGKTLAWVESKRARDNSRTADTVILVLDLSQPAAAPRRVTAGSGAGSCIERQLAWSPDSTHLAFLSNCATPGQSQLYVVPASGQRARKLTSLTGSLANPRWSPDGRKLAILYIENAPRAAGPLEATIAETGVIEAAIFEQRLTTIDVSSGEARQVTPADMYVYEYDWAPDSARLVYTAAQGAGDANWYIARLFTVEAGASQPREILKPSTQIAVPRWSPDGRTIAFIGGLMSDEGMTGGDIYTIPSAGGAVRRIAAENASPAWLHWLPGAHRLLTTERQDGGSAVAVLDLKSGAREVLWRGDESIGSGAEDLSLSVTADGGTVALLRSSWSEAPAVWSGPADKWQRRTGSEDKARPQWGETRKLHWRSDDFDVQGWLVYPKEYDPAQRYPMVVWVHGGPAGMEAPRWPADFDPVLFASEGYFVFLPNPRGSYGAGERFTTANVRDFGYGDLRDILAGVNKAIETAPVDPRRVGISGWSYGGFMTMWAVTQTNRFRAAVAGAGVANWQSYYGQNAIDQWMIPYFGGSVYDDPAAYARSSPMTFIKNVKTPTLVLVGERDGECPPPQSYEFWHALKALGVKTQLVVYPGEGHAFRNPQHVRDRARRMVSWFNENLR